MENVKGKPTRAYQVFGVMDPTVQPDGFDSRLFGFAKSLVLGAILGTPRPTLGNVADALGVTPERVSSLIGALDLEEDYAIARRKAFKKYIAQP